MVNVEDMRLRGAGSSIKRKIWDAARDTIQEWTGEELTDCSLYGIRVYTEGSVLATHVDRMPLVSSAILNVDQDVDEPWPIEVYAHDGKAYNVTMEPGDMVSNIMRIGHNSIVPSLGTDCRARDVSHLSSPFFTHTHLRYCTRVTRYCTVDHFH